MNLSKTLILALGALSLAACGGGGGGELPEGDWPETTPPAPSASFVHTAMPGNTVGSLTTLDHPLVNGNASAFLLVTPNWIPGGGGLGVYLNHNISVRYLGERWYVQFADLAEIPAGAVFNVTVSTGRDPAGAEFGLHRTAAANVDWHRSVIDHPETNGNPAAVILITQNASPVGELGPEHDHTTGLVYDTERGQWAIYNRDSERMPEGVAFNFAVVGPGTGGIFQNAAYAVNAAEGNSMDLGLANGSDAILQATPVFDPFTEVAYVARFGVFFNGTLESWVIFNQNATRIRAGVAFNVAAARP